MAQTKNRVQDLNGLAPNGAAKKILEEPPENHPMVATPTVEQLQANNMELQKQLQLQIQQVTAMHDLRSGNHDLIQGMQATGLGAQALTQLTPLVMPLFGDAIEAALEQGADYGFFELELEVRNQ